MSLDISRLVGPAQVMRVFAVTIIFSATGLLADDLRVCEVMKDTLVMQSDKPASEISVAVGLRLVDAGWTPTGDTQIPESGGEVVYSRADARLKLSADNLERGPTHVRATLSSSAPPED
ncbi:hypothetical protein ENSA5_30320 [Enhygromyxa salina]|uniref:Uncharacterized protein n=1 Tax=Enhygromyxa salina TaxID=215803 RepID=A0A2S9XZM9_9BACT|nr:hypothetical protein [Enhygromyxa salina]PRP98299.1 hypothetical protein ENSA5_30320 [Enhygromyxa salina]